MPDKETKHFLFSKIFVSSCVGLVSTVTMGVLRAKGYDVIIGADTQLYITGILMGFIGYWRTKETKQLRAKAAKNV